MDKLPLVVLLGDSLAMEGIAFELMNSLLINVVRIDPSLLKCRDCWKCLEPGLILFELGAPGSETLLALLNEQPNTQLAGLDLLNCRLVVMTGHQHITQSMQDLLRVIEKRIGQTTGLLEGG